MNEKNVKWRKSKSQKVTVPTVQVPVPQRWERVMSHLFIFWRDVGLCRPTVVLRVRYTEGTVLYLHFHTQTPSSSSFRLLLHTHGQKLIIDGSVFSKCRRLVLYLPLPVSLDPFDSCWSQSRQSAKLFLQSSELGLPHPPTRERVFPPPHPLIRGGGIRSLAGEGLGESQFRRGYIHCGTL